MDFIYEILHRSYIPNCSFGYIDVYSMHVVFCMKIAKEKAERAGGASGAVSAAPSATQTPAPAAQKREYNDAKLQVKSRRKLRGRFINSCELLQTATTLFALQIRLPDGRALTQTFGAKEPLAAVRLYVSQNISNDAPFKLMTNFPKKVFGDDDMETPLSALGKLFDINAPCSELGKNSKDLRDKCKTAMKIVVDTPRTWVYLFRSCAICRAYGNEVMTTYICVTMLRFSHHGVFRFVDIFIRYSQRLLTWTFHDYHSKCTSFSCVMLTAIDTLLAWNCGNVYKGVPVRDNTAF